VLNSARKIWEIFEPATKRRAFALLGLMLLGACAEALSIGMVFPLIQVALNPDDSGANVVVLYLVDWLNLSARESAGVMFAGMLIFFLLKNAYLLFLVHCQGSFIWGTLASLWVRMYSRYLGQPYEFHMQRNSSELVNNVTVTLRSMFYSFVMPVINMATELFIVLAICALLLWSAPLVTISSFVLLTALVVMYFLIFRRPLARWGGDQIKKQQSMILWLNQGMAGIKEVKTLGQEAYFLREFTDSSAMVAHYSRNNLLVTQMPRYIAETVVISSILIVIYYIGVVQNSAQDALPLMAMFSMAAFRLMPAVSRIASYMGHISFGGAALTTIHNDLMGPGPPVRNHADAAKVPAMKFDDRLSIENVSFRYAGADQDTLKNISIQIPRGASVALVGPSGAGKTTLADLILGLYQPTEGVILADGVDVSTNPEGWRRIVSCIPQRVFMLDAPVWANIALGRRADEIDPERMKQILKKSQLSETVAAMRDGIDTMVGEGGARMSGGQTQRIGIARSLYADADILIMDEATSALDSETEHAISKVVDLMKGDKTLIIIAHRLSTVRHCDCLYYMKDGRIIDSGTFEELYEKNEEFREMVLKMDVSVN